jgi:hypothetical protein
MIRTLRTALARRSSRAPGLAAFGGDGLRPAAPPRAVGWRARPRQRGGGRNLLHRAGGTIQSARGPPSRSFHAAASRPAFGRDGARGPPSLIRLAIALGARAPVRLDLRRSISACRASCPRAAPRRRQWMVASHHPDPDLRYGEDNLTQYSASAAAPAIAQPQHFTALARSARQFLPPERQLGNSCRAKQT